MFIMHRVSLYFCLLFSVAMMTAPFASAVQPNCDPFESIQRTVQSTCPESTIEYGADGNMLTLTASLASCASAKPESSVSVFFDQLVTPVIDKSTNEWILSYSIMWSDPSTSCVVDVTSTSATVTPKLPYALPNDRNGLNNSPLTNISEYALNQWYTRSFVISSSSLSSFRFGFTCASQTPGTNMKQVAYIRDISWKSGLNSSTVYHSLRSCVDCYDSPIEGADCLSFGDEYRWVYEGNVDIGDFSVNVPLTVIGNVTTYLLRVRKLLDIRGCLITKLRDERYEYSYSYIAIIGYRGSTVVILQDPGCTWPRFSVDPTPERAYPQLYNDSICDDPGSLFVVSNGSDVTTVTQESITIHVTDSAFECYYPTYGWIAIIVVPVVVGTAGIIIGVVFGVRRYRQRKRAKQLDLEMEQQAQRVDPMEHCPPTK